MSVVMKYKPAYCVQCDKIVKAEKPIKQVNHILHLLITIILGALTAGIGAIFWIIIWILLSLGGGGDIYLFGEKYNGFNCSECGSKNLKKPAENKSVPVKVEESNEIKLNEQDKKELKSLVDLRKMNVITIDELEARKNTILEKYN